VASILAVRRMWPCVPAGPVGGAGAWLLRRRPSGVQTVVAQLTHGVSHLCLGSQRNRRAVKARAATAQTSITTRSLTCSPDPGPPSKARTSAKMRCRTGK
jgi:hypothetical protein